MSRRPARQNEPETKRQKLPAASAIVPESSSSSVVPATSSSQIRLSSVSKSSSHKNVAHDIPDDQLTPIADDTRKVASTKAVGPRLFVKSINTKDVKFEQASIETFQQLENQINEMANEKIRLEKNIRDITKEHVRLSHRMDKLNDVVLRENEVINCEHIENNRNKPNIVLSNFPSVMIKNTPNAKHIISYNVGGIRLADFFTNFYKIKNQLHFQTMMFTLYSRYIFIHVALILYQLHSINITHNDLHTGNILLNINKPIAEKLKRFIIQQESAHPNNYPTDYDIMKTQLNDLANKDFNVLEGHQYFVQVYVYMLEMIKKMPDNPREALIYLNKKSPFKVYIIDFDRSVLIRNDAKQTIIRHILQTYKDDTGEHQIYTSSFLQVNPLNDLLHAAEIMHMNSPIMYHYILKHFYTTYPGNFAKVGGVYRYVLEPSIDPGFTCDYAAKYERRSIVETFNKNPFTVDYTQFVAQNNDIWRNFLPKQ
jgi:hypothetical protein